MAKVRIGKRVKVVRSDSPLPSKFVNTVGVVVGHNTNRLTGNTEDDPLHVVHVKGVGRWEFWAEELEVQRG